MATFFAIAIEQAFLGQPEIGSTAPLSGQYKTSADMSVVCDRSRPA